MKSLWMWMWRVLGSDPGLNLSLPNPWVRPLHSPSGEGLFSGGLRLAVSRDLLLAHLVLPPLCAILVISRGIWLGTAHRLPLFLSVLHAVSQAIWRGIASKRPLLRYVSHVVSPDTFRGTVGLRMARKGAGRAKVVGDDGVRAVEEDGVRFRLLLDRR